MPFDMGENHRARRVAQEDDLFPDWMGVWADGDDSEPLGELPKAGNGLWILCVTCWVQRWVGGQEMCEKWPEWLARPGTLWARALRCEHCHKRRFLFMCETDPGAAGFNRSPADTAPIIFARRLTAWLSGGPVSLDDLSPYLANMPTSQALHDADQHGMAPT